MEIAAGGEGRASPAFAAEPEPLPCLARAAPAEGEETWALGAAAVWAARESVGAACLRCARCWGRRSRAEAPA